MRRALLISAYHARSHAQWVDGVVRHCGGFDWHRVTLAPRHFAWRARGSAVTLLDRRYDALLDEPPEVLLATSMLDLATARACRRSLSACPAVLYFHENQFAYPARDERLLDVQLISLKSALSADRVVFNSSYNRTSFFAGARALLARMPDGVPGDLLAVLQRRSTVLPVPLSTPARPRCGANTGGAGRPLRILWNHRWEHDKAPQRLLAALRVMRARGIGFELHVAGQRFRAAPPAFDALAAEFGDRLATFGFVADAQAYRALLARADVVVSTALHEFQGLAVLDAVAAGCVPLVPDRLAYREHVARRFRYPSHPDDPAREAETLAERLEALCAAKSAGTLPAAPDVSALSWPRLAPAYAALLEQASRAR